MALKKYSLNGLYGCLISVTGVAFEERSKISSIVQELGGIYSPELKPQCSHLIFHNQMNNESEMMMAPAVSSQQSQSVPIKVQYARKWNIPVVSKDWIYACYSKRMLLEESDFPACPISSADNVDESVTEVLPVKLGDIQENTNSFLNGCQIYLNGDSISSQRLAVLKRLVLAAGGVRYNTLETGPPTHIVIHNQLLPNNLKDFLDNNSSSALKLVHDNWLFDSFKAGRRLPEDDYEVNKKPLNPSESTSVAPQKWKSAFNPATAVNISANLSINNGSFLNVNPNSSFGPLRTGLDGEEFLAGTPNVMESAGKALKGKSVFFALPSAKARKLASKTRKHEIHVVENEIEADWCITAVLISTDQYRELTTRRSYTHLRNEIWFEAAVESKTCLPSMSFAHPFSVRSFPISHLSKFVISQSGFCGAEREFFAELIKSSGAKYTDSLSKTNTHLLIEDPGNGLKFEFAKKWNIECITIDWFKNHFVSINSSGSFDENDLNIINNSQLSSKLTSTKPQELNFSQLTKSQNTYNLQLSQAKLSFQSQIVDRIPLSVSQCVSAALNPKEIFKGLVFASSQRLWHRREELSSVIESLGGVFLWSFDRNCTHYLHQGNLKEEAFKEFKQARQWEKFIVSPWWIFKCKEMEQKVDELMYPHTYKDISNCNEEIASDFSPKDRDNLNCNPNPNAYVDDTNITTNPQISLDWDTIMAERKAQELRFRPGSKNFNIDAVQAATTVATSFSTQTESFNENYSYGKVKTSTAGTLAPKFKVVFSGYSSSEKNELISLVMARPEFQVAAEEEEEEEPVRWKWNNKSTILVCNSVNYTEKIFSACATGCWILKKEFFLDKGTIDQFEKYELGPNWNSNEKDSLIGKIPRYWRKKFAEAELNNLDARPFKDWKCVLLIEASRKFLFESVLRNGGAQINDISSILNFKQITHVFCGNVNSIPGDFKNHFNTDQIFTTKHIINTIFKNSFNE